MNESHPGPCYLGRLEFITKMGFTCLSTAESNQTNKAQSYTRIQIYGVHKYLLNAVNITRTHPFAPSHSETHTLTKAHIISLVIHYALKDLSNKIIVCRLVRENYYLS